mmetsp:Transcript_43089/g.78344  ORF Transcript_43089/g.78344 Transcript_43089/m.78344 type:complete len:204 (-) Transcript_43089:110-721(-)
MDNALQWKIAMFGHPRKCIAFPDAHRSTSIHQPRLRLAVSFGNYSRDGTILPCLTLLGVVAVVLVINRLSILGIFAMKLPIVHAIVVIGRLVVVILLRYAEVQCLHLVILLDEVLQQSFGRTLLADSVREVVDINGLMAILLQVCKYPLDLIFTQVCHLHFVRHFQEMFKPQSAFPLRTPLIATWQTHNGSFEETACTAGHQT